MAQKTAAAPQMQNGHVGNREIRPTKAVVKVFGAVYEDGEIVDEFAMEDQILYRRDFDKLAEKVAESWASVEAQYHQQAG